MRQIQMDEPGPPSVLHVVEVADPAPGPGQVVVRADAIGITFIETQLRAGRSPRPGAEPMAMPGVLGNGVEGVIVQAGDGVDPEVVGQRVVTATGGLGGYAELVVVDAADPVPVPDGLPEGDAVALLADGRTALALVRSAELTGTDRVAITAAAGGVGSLLVQAARAAGVRTVVALASTDEKLAVARQLGADVAVDYSDPAWGDRVRAEVGGLDLVFDGVGGDIGATLVDLLDAGGRYSMFGAASGSMGDFQAAAERGLTVLPGHTMIKGPDDNRVLVEQALADAAVGRWHPVIGQRVPLADVVTAHEAIEQRRTIGKTILLP